MQRYLVKSGEFLNSRSLKAQRCITKAMLYYCFIFVTTHLLTVASCVAKRISALTVFFRLKFHSGLRMLYQQTLVIPKPILSIKLNKSYLKNNLAWVGTIGKFIDKYLNLAYLDVLRYFPCISMRQCVWSVFLLPPEMMPSLVHNFAGDHHLCSRVLHPLVASCICLSRLNKKKPYWFVLW